MSAIDSQPDEDPGATRRIDSSEVIAASRREHSVSGIGLVGLEAETLPPGTLAGPYVIDQILGAGGGGVVYAAEHQLLRRKAAVKVLRRCLVSSPSMVARFLREATAVNLVRHPNIVDIYEFNQLDDGRPYYVMELLDGKDVGKLLKLRGRFSPEEALAIFEPVCHALEAAHKVGVIHRDLKASNVIVVESRGNRTVKLVDFGIAKLTQTETGGPGLTEPGVLLGSVQAMSPEQLRCEAVDARSDVYSLGVLLYQLLTGEYPFKAQPQQVVWMHLDAQPPRPSQLAPISPALDAVVLRCLEKDRRQRYQTVAALLGELRAAVQGERAKVADQEASTKVFGCYVRVRLDEIPEEDLDDALLEDTAMILDTAGEILRNADFTLAFHTSNAVLGVTLYPVNPSEVAAARQRALDAAQSLFSELTEHSAADSRIHVDISLHADQAVLRTSGKRLEVAGGPILAVGKWAPRDALSEVHLSESFGS